MQHSSSKNAVPASQQIYNTPIFPNQCISQINFALAMNTQTTRRKLTPEFKAKELREGIKNYIEYYNTKRPHQGIEHQIPMTKYAKIAA